jgi:hypothetical protein
MHTDVAGDQKGILKQPVEECDVPEGREEMGPVGPGVSES